MYCKLHVHRAVRCAYRLMDHVCSVCSLHCGRAAAACWQVLKLSLCAGKDVISEHLWACTMPEDTQCAEAFAEADPNELFCKVLSLFTHKTC
jgi:hypothetical protein